MSSIDWGDVKTPKAKKQGSGGGNTKFSDFMLKLEAGNTYKVRPIGKPYPVYAFWLKNPHTNRFVRAFADVPRDSNGSIREDADEIIKDHFACIKYNANPSLRYVFHVIDRADNKLKLLEANPSIFNAISNWKNLTKENPGGMKGCDFGITVVPPTNPNDKKTTRYTTVALMMNEISDAEKAYLKPVYPYSVEKMYGATSEEDLAKKMAPQQQQESKQTVPAGTTSSGESEENFDF